MLLLFNNDFIQDYTTKFAITRQNSIYADKERTYSNNNVAIYIKELCIYIYYNLNLLFLSIHVKHVIRVQTVCN